MRLISWTLWSGSEQFLLAAQLSTNPGVHGVNLQKPLQYTVLHTVIKSTSH
jgi:hypothetical protein